MQIAERLCPDFGQRGVSVQVVWGSIFLKPMSDAQTIEHSGSRYPGIYAINGPGIHTS